MDQGQRQMRGMTVIYCCPPLSLSVFFLILSYPINVITFISSVYIVYHAFTVYKGHILTTYRVQICR